MKRAIEIKVNAPWSHWLNGFVRSVIIAAACGGLSQVVTKGAASFQDGLHYFYVAGAASLLQYLTTNRMPDIFPEEPSAPASPPDSPQTETERPPNNPGGRSETVRTI